MRIFMTGATGFIGRALLLRLRHEGHQVVAWVRSEADKARLGAEAETLATHADDAELARVLSRVDGVVNLAGSPITGRWTESKRGAVRDSRVGTTTKLVRAIEHATARPRVLVSGSAVGYYGDRGDDALSEDSAPGSGFLATICAAWENAAARASGLGVRVVTTRTGVVLGREGGMLQALLPIFKLGAGGPVGSGKQWISWVHLADVVDVIVTALADERYTGPINVTAPKPITNEDFARALGRALGRSASLRVPASLVRFALGEAAEMLLGGQRALPARLFALGYRHAFPDLDAALADVLEPRANITRMAPETAAPADVGSRYLEERRPSFVLTSSTVIDTRPEDAFAFFSHPENLGLMTPPRLGLEIAAAPPVVSTGSNIDVRIKVGPLPVRWTTRIEDWEPSRRFIDSQVSGPYRSWWHEHEFRAEGDRTVMEDRVFYSVPFGPLGRVLNRLFIAPSLTRIFGFRRDAIRLRFGARRPEIS